MSYSGCSTVMESVPIVSDRTRMEATEDCYRKRYWGYQYGDWGLEPDGPVAVDLAYGLAFHEGAEVLGLGGSLADALTVAKRWTSRIEGVTIDGLAKSDEYYALAYGHLRTFHEVILPALMERYTIRAVELESVLPLADDVLDMTRLDIALQDKQTGDNYYVEYKTDTNPSDIGHRMEFNLQFVLGVAALSRALSEPVTGSIIIGVDKGPKRGPSEKEKAAGKTGERREGPFTYAYALDTGFDTKWRLEWTRNWKKLAPWSVMTPMEWYEKLILLAPDVAREQFVISEPIIWTEEAFISTARQVVARERRIKEGVIQMNSTASPEFARDILDEYFPMSRKNCRNDGGYKRPCPFIDLCHFAVGVDPLSRGYRWRGVNHPLEVTVRRRPE